MDIDIKEEPIEKKTFEENPQPTTEKVTEEKKEQQATKDEDVPESLNPAQRETVFLFEFSDSYLNNKINSDVNPCSKKERGSARKIPWRRMTPALFQEIYNWELTQPRVKQCQIQSKFNVNRSTYYRWKKKYIRENNLEPTNPPEI